ncbi:hypothetical protein [Psittacicella hinzii]|uniref:Uncharacterized protein n=1 Tax=Psittacicella hinzii TaxID=2028575 RepID=A0A3A1YIR2_9GAMM|nr:hypothetical protein [Psittacicella hinzii]RIY37481.1 hypothetical protein CKF58_04995 [Psittacicella hinzii]
MTNINKYALEDSAMILSFLRTEMYRVTEIYDEKLEMLGIIRRGQAQVVVDPDNYMNSYITLSDEEKAKTLTENSPKVDFPIFLIAGKATFHHIVRGVRNLYKLNPTIKSLKDINNNRTPFTIRDVEKIGSQFKRKKLMTFDSKTGAYEAIVN